MDKRPALPISLYVANRKVVMVGRPEAVHERAAQVRAAAGQVLEVDPADYDADLCRGAFLVMALTGDRDQDRLISADARAHGCLRYAHDQPDHSDMAMPALARRGALTLAVSTDGTAPALARRLRQELQALVDGAGQALDRLLADLAAERRRDRGDKARLTGLARTLRIAGHIAIDPEPERPAPERPR